jgi:hypothetical protein
MWCWYVQTKSEVDLSGTCTNLRETSTPIMSWGFVKKPHQLRLARFAPNHQSRATGLFVVVAMFSFGLFANSSERFAHNFETNSGGWPRFVYPCGRDSGMLKGKDKE